MSGDSFLDMKLHDPNHAVDEYLDRLLSDDALESAQALPTEENSAEEAMVPDPTEPTDLRQSDSVGEPAGCLMRNEMPPSTDKPSRVQQAVDEIPHLDMEKAEAPVKDSVYGQSDVEADWTKHSRQSISLFKFRVMGINFAVPLESCAGDYPGPEDITCEPVEPKWLIGEISLDGERIRMVNIAAMVIPDSKRESLPFTSRPRCTRVLRVAGAEWGFVCEGNVERIDLPCDKIHWRTKQSKRQWLAGTIVDLKCALLDVSVIEQSMDR